MKGIFYNHSIFPNDHDRNKKHGNSFLFDLDPFHRYYFFISFFLSASYPQFSLSSLLSVSSVFIGVIGGSLALDTPSPYS